MPCDPSAGDGGIDVVVDNVEKIVERQIDLLAW